MSVVDSSASRAIVLLSYYIMWVLLLFPSSVSNLFFFNLCSPFRNGNFWSQLPGDYEVQHHVA